MKLKDMRIGKRLVGGFGIFILIIIISAFISAKNTSDNDDAINMIVNVNFEKAVLANTILTNIQSIAASTANAIITKDKSLLQTVIEKRKIYAAALEKLELTEKEETGKKLIAKLKSDTAQGRAASEKLRAAFEANNYELAGTVYNSEMVPAVAKNIDTMTEIVKFQQDSIKTKYKEIMERDKKVRLVLVLFTVIALALSAAVTVLITKSITEPITKTMEVARTLAEGNLTVHVDVDRKDEFGDEMSAFGEMVSKWQGLIREVKTSATSVASASHELGASAEQLARGATAQVEQTIQVSTASEEMSQASLDIAKNTNNISDSAKDMVDTAHKGSGIVNKSVAEVREIEKTVQKSSDFVKTLGSQSEKINEIVNVINEIADQTNLLALNAAIEAARAGEAGRGFAVVADEVKKLAERTGKSTQEIGAMIGSIKSGVENAVMAMDEASDKVKTGVELSGEAGVALEEIVNSASNLQSMVQQIAAAIEQMNSTTDEIAKDIERVASVTKESSSSAERVTQAAVELDTLSVRLDNAVREFRV